MKIGVKKTMKGFRNTFLKMIKHRKESELSQRDVSDKMSAVYHYVNKIENDIEAGNINGKTVLLAARYADAIGMELKFKVVEKE